MTARLETHPEGWFLLAFSADLAPGRERSGVLCGAPYALRRDPQGQVQADGVRVVAEQDGMILGYHHPQGLPPKWTVPALDTGGWQPLVHRSLCVRTHPQETSENSVDVAHFRQVHRYESVSVQHVASAGEQLRVRLHLSRANPFLLSVLGRVRVQLDIRLYGLGYSRVDVEMAGIGLRSRLLILSTPTQQGRSVVTMALSMNRHTRLPWWLPHRFLLPFFQQLAFREAFRDLQQDIAIWENKRYLRRPLLVKNDGPIAQYRKWSARFYAPVLSGVAS